MKKKKKKLQIFYEPDQLMVSLVSLKFLDFVAFLYKRKKKQYYKLLHNFFATVVMWQCVSSEKSDGSYVSDELLLIICHIKIYGIVLFKKYIYVELFEVLEPFHDITSIQFYGIGEQYNKFEYSIFSPLFESSTIKMIIFCWNL